MSFKELLAAGVVSLKQRCVRVYFAAEDKYNSYITPFEL